MTHGYSGYTNHGCRCDECRSANREYMRKYRKTHPEDRKDRLTRGRAFRALAKRHPEEYRSILDAERAIEGLPPVGTAPRGRRPWEAA